MFQRIRIYDIRGRIVRRSQNLRGILDHARRFEVVTISAYESEGKYKVRFGFSNDDWARVEFADWRVLVDWIRARRSWDATFTFPAHWIRLAKADCN